MNIPSITVVAGLSGTGKTTWIRQQIREIKPSEKFEKLIYFSPGTGNVLIDHSCIASEFPGIKVFGDNQEIEFIHHIPEANHIYIELGSYLELSTISQILDNLNYRAVAILPPNDQNSEYHTWTEEIFYGAPVEIIHIENIWRVCTTGQVIDENSLEDFWYEITHGAYGEVIRAKGIFDVNDGRSIYCDFVAGVPQTEFLELDLPRYLEGRPQRFSGLEISGTNLDEPALKSTLSDCCLSDYLISQYQQQVKQILLEGQAV
ncbi:GTP-binding protein [Anabaena aphanizomenioides LEGE 00250]|jgi:G3E family GTPase|uniref:GTP-binding protein n=1 Tax=Sphaerospermopsis aphanizomenoides LEGE 00250 TaxID=2777972 RepID=A0ABR9VJ23_9CYAN|nr:GTP-binding protein [Sphaerospermopsis aphanizomenoides]MBE9238496.1 GTP-binding protein [Sphaerospermopsis aphanizomenoides LEGE 00250]